MKSKPRDDLRKAEERWRKRTLFRQSTHPMRRWLVRLVIIGLIIGGVVLLFDQASVLWLNKTTPEQQETEVLLPQPGKLPLPPLN